jgi:hypothetical protein
VLTPPPRTDPRDHYRERIRNARRAAEELFRPLEPNEKRVYGTYQSFDGRSIICTVPVTDDELALYKHSPDTFFSVVRPVSKGIKTPLDAYDFFFETYSKSSRKKLLQFMAQSPDIERLRTLSRRELAEEYAAGMATTIWRTLGQPKN